MRPRILLIGTGVAVIIILAVIYARYGRDNTTTTQSPLVNQATLTTLPKQDNSTADTTHLASSIIPPTNSWLSGMVLQKTPQAVYPMPLTFLAKEAGFEIGLPTITVNPTAIVGGHTAGVAATIDQASAFQLTRYDKISATLTYKNSTGSALAKVTLAEGVPYVYYHALASGTVTLADVNIPPQTAKQPNYIRYTKAGHDYVVATDKGSSLSATGSTIKITTGKDSLVTFYALPGSGDDKLRQYADNELASVQTSYAVTDDTVTTTLNYETATNRPTVYAPMGYASTQVSDPVVATYQNIYGSMKAYSGNTSKTTAKKTKVSTQLDLSHLSNTHKATLVSMLDKDATTVKITAQDSYYAGKQLARTANLLTIAKQLNQTAAANQLQATLKGALIKRLDSSYFYYDSKIHGIAATTNAFGSEDFNDHHFHYGYFIYAASVLGRYDASFVTDYRDHVNLLVADIASYELSNDFPIQRNYDAYAGHSWAAGLAPFADGNNQESSSEAMNAWNAVASWGELIKNDNLIQAGQWMLANESVAARNVWRTPPSDIPNRAEYTSPMTVLNFGGKLTYSTFFSDEPSAKLGIQLISMNPFMAELPDDTSRIRQLVDSSVANDEFNKPLADYILMYLSLSDPQRASELAAKQQDRFIDDGNSRTYLNAFIFSQLDS